jgi:hypothetical protein
MATSAREPWKAEPHWHPARREAFEVYRDLGAERSYPKVARALSKSTTLVKRWASEDGWRERVQAWDVECDRRRREEFHDASADIARAQAEDAAALREALLSPARAVQAKLAKMAAEGRDPFEGMSAAELVRLSATTGRVFAQVVQVERLAWGLSSENVGQPLVPPEVERKSTAELEA